MAENALQRPRRLGIACVIAGAVAFLQLVQALGGLSTIGSRDQQDVAREALRTWGLAGQVDIDTALGWLGIYYQGSAVLAVVIGVLAVYVARGHRGSRTALTVVAPVAALAFLVLGVPGVLPAAMLVYALAGTWSADGRWWYTALQAKEQGRPVPPSPADLAAERTAERTAERAERIGADLSQRQPPPPPLAPPSAGAPTDGGAARPGERPFAGGPQPPPPWGPPARPVARRGRAPRSVNVAVLITSVLAGLVGLVCGVNALVYLVAPTAYREAISSQDAGAQLMAQTGLGADELSHWLFIGTAGGAALAACALAAALWMLLRAAPARIVLTVLSSLTIGLSIAAFPVGLIWGAGAGYVVYLLYRDETKAWFRKG